jgi:hypothetical protein
MKHRAEFFVQGRYLGSGLVEEQFHGTAGVCRPRSKVFVCPTCGDLWARIVVEGAKHFPLSHPCEKHEARGFYDMIPGSVYEPWETKLLEAYPRELLLRETKLHIDHWRKFNGYETEAV